jgi:DNA polymerase III subunit epsilon
MDKIFYYDLETTGTDSKKNAIHQIAVGYLINGEIRYKEFKMCPFEGAIIDPKALEVGGKTEDEIKSYPPQNVVFLEFIMFLEGLIDKCNNKDKFHLAGYNIMAFDNQFLRNWFGMNGNNYFGSYFWSDSIDVMALASNYLRKHRATMLNFKQGTVAKKLGINVDESRLHDAVYDLEICIQIHKKTEECCWTANNLEP